MGERRAGPTPGWSRRWFLTAAGLGLVGPMAAGRAARARTLDGDDPDRLPPFERLHLPRLTTPAVVGNGAKVPVVLEMAHPMEADHSIATVRVVNARDPVPGKGVFHLTPANGRVYVSYQVRLDAGVSEVSASAECTRHGPWSAGRAIRVVDGGGGCAAAAPPAARMADEIRAPAIRIPELVKRGRLKAGETVLVQLLMRHPSRTGLALRDGQFIQETEPLYLKDVDVMYGGERVSRFELTSALGDDPFIGFTLRVRQPGPLVVVLANNRGQRFEAAEQIRFS